MKRTVMRKGWGGLRTIITPEPALRGVRGCPHVVQVGSALRLCALPKGHDGEHKETV